MDGEDRVGISVGTPDHIPDRIGIRVTIPAIVPDRLIPEVAIAVGHQELPEVVGLSGLATTAVEETMGIVPAAIPVIREATIVADKGLGRIIRRIATTTAVVAHITPETPAVVETADFRQAVMAEVIAADLAVVVVAVAAEAEAAVADSVRSNIVFT